MATIYVSSTYEDLKEYRQQAYATLRKMRHDVIAMEDYVAKDKRPLDKCLDDVKKCDLYIGIIAWRYGYVPAKDNPDKRSITELELRCAESEEVPRLLFLSGPKASWSAETREEDPESTKLKVLREYVATEYTVAHFHSPENLARDVAVAVAAWEKELATAGQEPLSLVFAQGTHWPSIDMSVRNDSGAPIQITSIQVRKLASIKDELGSERHLLGPRVSLDVSLKPLKIGQANRIFGKDTVSTLDPGEAEAFALGVKSSNAASMVELEVEWIGAGAEAPAKHRSRRLLAIHSPLGETDSGAIEAVSRETALQAVVDGELPGLWPNRPYSDSGVQSLLMRTAAHLCPPDYIDGFERLRRKYEDTFDWGPILTSFAEAEVLTQDHMEPIRAYFEGWIRNPDQVRAVGVWDTEAFSVTILHALSELEPDPRSWRLDVFDHTVEVELSPVELVLGDSPVSVSDEEFEEVLRDSSLSSMRSAIAKGLLANPMEGDEQLFLVLALLTRNNVRAFSEREWLHTSLSQLPQAVHPSDDTMHLISTEPRLSESTAEALGQWWSKLDPGVRPVGVWREHTPRLARIAPLVLGPADAQGMASVSVDADPVERLAYAVSPGMNVEIGFKLAKDPHSGVRFALVQNQRTPEEILRELTNDEDELVSGWAARRLETG